MTWARAFALALAFTVLFLVLSGMVASSGDLGPFPTSTGDDVVVTP